MTGKSVCFFSSYFHGTDLPYYIRIYLKELSRHFSDVILLTNTKELNDESSEWLKNTGALYRIYKNEGYDFGMWQKAFAEFHMEDYDEVALINDSCILFAPLDDVFTKIRKSGYDYCGLIASSQVQWHIQSYFLVLGKNAIQPAGKYFSEQGITQNFEDTIIKYEVGLTKYMQSLNLKTGAIFHSELSGSKFNPSYMDIEGLIRKGFPVIKRKLIFGNYRKEELPGLLYHNFNFRASYYISIINSVVKDPIIDFYTLKEDYYTASRLIRLSILQIISKVILSPLQLFRKLTGK